MKAKGLILVYSFYLFFFLAQAVLEVSCASYCGLHLCHLKKTWHKVLQKMGCGPRLVLASTVWCKEGHFKYSQANGITCKSILLPKKEHNIRWVKLWSERWANLLYCCMILNLFPFPAMKESSEVHLLHFPSLCSLHNNYFSVLLFKNKHISSLKEMDQEGFVYQNSFSSQNFTYKGWFTAARLLGMGLSRWGMSPPRVIQASYHVSQSL